MNDPSPEGLRKFDHGDLRKVLRPFADAWEDNLVELAEERRLREIAEAGENIAIEEERRCIERLEALERERKIVSGVLAGQVAVMRRHLDGLYELAHDLRMPPLEDHPGE